MKRELWFLRAPHPELAGMLAALPDEWSKEKRDQFVAAFVVVLDYAIPVREDTP